MYATLVRNAGWTFAECGDQPACDVFDFLEHLQEYPPDYIILAAVHGVKPKAVKPKAMTEEQMAEQSRHLRATLPTAPVPPHLRELVQWSKKQDELAGK